jgi:hypothetical protein
MKGHGPNCFKYLEPPQAIYFLHSQIWAYSSSNLTLTWIIYALYKIEMKARSITRQPSTEAYKSWFIGFHGLLKMKISPRHLMETINIINAKENLLAIDLYPYKQRDYEQWRGMRIQPTNYWLPSWKPITK